jgi:hypothetical protein
MERSSGCKFICNGAAWIYAATRLPPGCEIISLEKGFVYGERQRRNLAGLKIAAPYGQENAAKMGRAESGIQKR